MSEAAAAPSAEGPGWRPWTVPNLISLARLCCLPWFVWLVFGAEDRWGAALLLGVLGATDWVDGWVARRFDQVSELGKILDPTADRLLLLVALVVMIVDGSLPLWVAAVALFREAVVSVAALVLGALGARKIDVTWWGKTGTFLMMFAVSLLSRVSQRHRSSGRIRGGGVALRGDGLADPLLVGAGLHPPSVRGSARRARWPGERLSTSPRRHGWVPCAGPKIMAVTPIR